MHHALIAMLTKERKTLQTDAFGEHTMQQNADGASSTPSKPLAGFQEAEREIGNGGKGKEEGEGKGRRG